MVERVVKTEKIENLIHLVLNFIDEQDFHKAKEQIKRRYFNLHEFDCFFGLLRK